MRQKGQVLMYNDQQLSLLNNTFSGDENRLYLIRNVLQQFPMTEGQIAELQSFLTPAVLEVVKMRVLPEVDPESPLTQISDMYQSLNNDLKAKDADGMAPLFAAKKIEIDYLTQQFKILENISVKSGEPQDITIRLDSLKNIDISNPLQTYINTTARNFLLSYIESSLNLIKNLAGTPDETPEQRTKRLTRDSSK